MIDFFNFNFLQGFVASIITAFLFSFIIFVLLKPSVEIGKEIACLKNENGSIFYKIKFINKSFFKAFDVVVELLKVIEKDVTPNSDGVNVKVESIQLSKTDWLFVERWKKTKDKRYAHHCVTVRVIDSKNDLEQILKDNNTYLEFRLVLKHGFSNFSGVFKQRFKTIKCIKQGDFEFGNKIKIS